MGKEKEKVKGEEEGRTKKERP
jgi:hypothetical protein